MAGHSHSANIWNTKSAQDSKRSKVFTRISKDIYNAVKIGRSSDPALNPLLRSTIERAKSANIPQDRIQRAIDKASGKGDEKEIMQSKIYEVLSPENKYILIEAETDNPTRTVAEVKLVINRAGYKMLESGSALRFFDEIGELKLNIQEAKIENIIDKSISTNGIIDYVFAEDNSLILFIEKELLKEYVDKVSEWKEVSILEARIIYKCNLKQNFSINEEASLTELKEKLFELQDITEIWY